jgi:hypothetical protein
MDSFRKRFLIGFAIVGFAGVILFTRNHLEIVHTSWLPAVEIAKGTPSSELMLKEKPGLELNKVFRKIGTEIYYLGDYESGVISGADINSFQLLCETSECRYARDSGRIYYVNSEIKGADLATFKVDLKSDRFATDKMAAYIDGQKIPNIDLGSFEVIDELHYKDQNNVYIDSTDYSGVIKNADPQTFSALSVPEFSKDKKHGYFFETLIEGADGLSFQALNARYAKDEKNVYFMARVLSGVDRDSFKTPYVHNVWYASDKDYVYNAGKKIPEADPMTFTVLENDLPCGRGCTYRAEDKNSRFDYNDKIVQKK